MVVLSSCGLRRTRRLGFNLTELVLVMAVFGTVLTGIWLAYDNVTTSQKYDRAQRQLITILQNIRSLYANNNSFTCAQAGPDWACDITTAMVRSGVFPADTLRPDNPATPAIREDLLPLTPWGTTWYVESLNPASPQVVNQQQVQIGTASLPNNANSIEICAQMLARNLSASRDPGLVRVLKQFNNVTRTNRAVSIDCAANSVCDPASAANFCQLNNRAIGFALRYNLKL